MRLLDLVLGNGFQASNFNLSTKVNNFVLFYASRCNLGVEEKK